MIEDYGAGDHLNETTGRSKWTRQLSGDLQSILHDSVGFDDQTGFMDASSPTIINPPGDRIVVSGKMVFIQASCTKMPLLSFYADSNKLGERYLGATDTCSFNVPQDAIGNRVLCIFAYCEGHKTLNRYRIIDSMGTNRPPFVDAGPDDNATVNVPYQLHGSITDDSLPPNGKLWWHWSIIQGTATMSDSLILNPIITISQLGTSIFRLNASDGDLQAFDDVTITVNQSGKIDIYEPSDSTAVIAGGILSVRWQSSGIINASISLSYDGGKSWQETNELLFISDSAWGDVSIPVPADAPSTQKAQIKVASYDGLIVGRSALFSIANKSKILNPRLLSKLPPKILFHFMDKLVSIAVGKVLKGSINIMIANIAGRQIFHWKGFLLESSPSNGSLHLYVNTRVKRNIFFLTIKTSNEIIHKKILF
jgi:hypothetical protein